MNGNCAHNCVNTEGTYYCTCDNGYELSDDKHTCEGNVMWKYIYVCKIVHVIMSTMMSNEAMKERQTKIIPKTQVLLHINYPTCIPHSLHKLLIHILDWFTPM